MMKSLSVLPFVSIGEDIRRVQNLYFEDSSFVPTKDIKEDEHASNLTPHFKAQIRAVMKDMADAIGLLGVAETERFIRDHADDDEIPDSVGVYDTVCKAFWRALLGKKVFFLSQADLAHYEMPLAGYDARVFVAFQNVREEIAEASKCLAFNLPTAAVCHLMRGMERAVARMASHLGVTNVEKEWGKLLADIQGKVKVLPDAAIQKKWTQACDHLWNVKESLRNDTFHARDAGYSIAQAEELFQRIRSFLTYAAALIDPPAPKATPDLVVKSAPNAMPQRRDG